MNRPSLSSPLFRGTSVILSWYRRTSIVFAIGLLSTLSVSCTTLGSMQKSAVNKGGSVRLYDAPYTIAFKTALHACEVLSFNIESADEQQGYIVANNGISAWSWGERIGLYLKEKDEDKTELRVISKPKVKTNIFAPKWSDEIHIHMNQRLQQLREAGLLK